MLNHRIPTEYCTIINAVPFRKHWKCIMDQQNKIRNLRSQKGLTVKKNNTDFEQKRTLCVTGLFSS